MDFSIDDNIAENTLMKFYEVATKEPQYQGTYHEDDGSLTLSEPLISRPMGDWIRKNLGEWLKFSIQWKKFKRYIKKY